AEGILQRDGSSLIQGASSRGPREFPAKSQACRTFGFSALHAAGGVSRLGRAGGARRGKPRGGGQMEARRGDRKNPPQSPRSVARGIKWNFLRFSFNCRQVIQQLQDRAAPKGDSRG